jgi:hypothetical protein
MQLADDRELVVELDESLMVVMADMNTRCNEYRMDGEDEEYKR